MIKDFRSLIIAPALKCIGKWSQSAENLLFMTALAESNVGEYLKQIGGGSALGPYQIEPVTYQNVIKWLNRYDNRAFKENCLCACFYDAPPSEDALIHNLRWSTIVARTIYLTINRPLPRHDDVEGLARYHKDYYNRNGAATIERTKELYQRTV